MAIGLCPLLNCEGDRLLYKEWLGFVVGDLNSRAIAPGIAWLQCVSGPLAEACILRKWAYPKYYSGL